MGISERAALEAAGNFGTLFDAMGMGSAATLQMSEEMTQLAVDLASFNNISIDEALTKLRSGLVGEAEPLRTVGVLISAAAVDAKALEMGMTRTNGVFTEAQKVQARYALILDQTASAQGDYGRTADGYANSQRKLDAAMENLSATIGTMLLPYMTKLVNYLANDVVPALSELARWLDENAVLFDALGYAIDIGLSGPIKAADNYVKAHTKTEEEAAAASLKAGEAYIRTGTMALNAFKATTAGAVQSADSIVAGTKHIISAYVDIANYLLGTYNTNFSAAMDIQDARVTLSTSKIAEEKAKAYATLQEHQALTAADYDAWISLLESMAKGTKGKVHDAYMAAISDVRALRAEAAKTITVNIKYKAGPLPPGVSNKGYLSGYASGGVTSGGPAWVGEQGPEIVDLPAGSRVHSASDSKKMGGVTVNINGPVYGDGPSIDRLTNMIAQRLNYATGRLMLPFPTLTLTIGG